MAQMTIRDLDDRVYRRLKARAKANQRSLEAEVRVILGAAVGPAARGEFIAWSKRFLAGQEVPKDWDSVAAIRAERDRRFL
jgi:plasmid stability protein